MLQNIDVVCIRRISRCSRGICARMRGTHGTTLPGMRRRVAAMPIASTAMAALITCATTTTTTAKPQTASPTTAGTDTTTIHAVGVIDRARCRALYSIALPLRQPWPQRPRSRSALRLDVHEPSWVMGHCTLIVDEPRPSLCDEESVGRLCRCALGDVYKAARNAGLCATQECSFKHGVVRSSKCLGRCVLSRMANYHRTATQLSNLDAYSSFLLDDASRIANIDCSLF